MKLALACSGKGDVKEHLEKISDINRELLRRGKSKKVPREKVRK